MKKSRSLLFNSIAMVPESCACQSPCVNPLTDPAGEQNELTGTQGQKKSNIGSNETSIEASTLPKALTLPLVPPSTKNFFIKFMKMFIESIQT